MYWVKEHGKNNVHVAQPTDEPRSDAKSVMSADVGQGDRPNRRPGAVCRSGRSAAFGTV